MIGSLWTVTASTMITRFKLWRKVRCHSGAVEMSGSARTFIDRVEAAASGPSSRDRAYEVNSRNDNG